MQQNQTFQKMCHKNTREKVTKNVNIYTKEDI